ncbi:unnamed protein product [Lampetra fluviatilis]
MEDTIQRVELNAMLRYASKGNASGVSAVDCFKFRGHHSIVLKMPSGDQTRQSAEFVVQRASRYTTTHGGSAVVEWSQPYPEPFPGGFLPGSPPEDDLAKVSRTREGRSWPRVRELR